MKSQLKMQPASIEKSMDPETTYPRAQLDPHITNYKIQISIAK